MNVVFYHSDKAREHRLAEAFNKGVQRHGHTFEARRMAEYEDPLPETDVAIMVAVKGNSRRCMEDHLLMHRHVIYIDKGYIRTRDQSQFGHAPEFWRMSRDAFQPLDYFQKIPRPADRWNQLKIEMQPFQKMGETIIIAGGSLKYAMWHRFEGGERGDGTPIDPATRWAEKVVTRIRKRTSRMLVYRPKPSWRDAKPIMHARYSRPPKRIQDELKEAWALITYGSNAAVDALFAGVPVFVLGDGIARPLARTDLDQIEDPYYPTDEERQQWAQDLAYCQFTLDETASGLAWEVLMEGV